MSSIHNKTSSMDKNQAYKCWLRNDSVEDSPFFDEYKKVCSSILVSDPTPVIDSACNELFNAIRHMLGFEPQLIHAPMDNEYIALGITGRNSWIDEMMTPEEMASLNSEGYIIKTINRNDKKVVLIGAKTDNGVLYGVFAFLKLLKTNCDISNLSITDNPVNPLRMINHWDNMDGSIERGYAGQSIFYKNNKLVDDFDRIKDYARLMASIGINGIVINNVNVHYYETMLIDNNLDMVEKISDIFAKYGIKLFLSINYASPMEIGGLHSADPMDPQVQKWWQEKIDNIYDKIPEFGGFIVKADSENRPGPYMYNRNHAEGANMLAEALDKHNGILIWRCFVYNCKQDWRDLSIDRAKAAYENYKYLDGQFRENVILQIKNGPMDFQVREPVSPLFGAMPKTNQMLEFQITQEYTGQQRHLCYLIPQWKEVLDYETYAKDEGSTVKEIVAGTAFNHDKCGIAAVSNIGDDDNWTGHFLAQANLYGYGRLAWNPDLSSEDITEEWIRLTLGNDEEVVDTISEILLPSWHIYENYTSPLGIGWMVNPNHHYGPNVDGYEYSMWGTYHKANHYEIGIDRTTNGGTGYTGQYFEKNKLLYESLETCPDELLLFFHRLPYTHKLKSGKTIIQHIYDTHFEGVEQVKELKNKWESLKDKIDNDIFEQVIKRFDEQIEHAREWRDVINSYFYRKTAIPDDKGRTIY